MTEFLDEETLDQLFITRLAWMDEDEINQLPKPECNLCIGGRNE